MRLSRDAERRPAEVPRQRICLPLDSPSTSREYARLLVEAGANIVGGCCGTTPEHIAEMREALDREWNRKGRVPSATTVTVARVRRRRAGSGSAEGPSSTRRSRAGRAAAAESRARCARSCRDGEFVVSVELDPPRGLNPRKVIEGAAAAQAARRRLHQHRRQPDGARAHERHRAGGAGAASAPASSRSSTSRRATGT